MDTVQRGLSVLLVWSALLLVSGSACADVDAMADVADPDVRALVTSLESMGLTGAAMRVLANYRATPHAAQGALSSPLKPPPSGADQKAVSEPPVRETSVAKLSSPPTIWSTPDLRGVELLEDTGARIQVRKFELNRTALIPEDELQTLLSNLVGQELDFSQLRSAASRITEHYRSKGFVARAVLPVQTLDFGLVKIVVLESRPVAVAPP